MSLPTTNSASPSSISGHQILANISCGYLDTPPTTHQVENVANDGFEFGTTMSPTPKIQPWVYFACVDAGLYMMGLFFMWLANSQWTFVLGEVYSDAHFVFYLTLITVQLACFIPVMLFMYYARNEPEILSRHRFFAAQVVILTFLAILLRILYLMLVFQKLPYKYGTEDYTVSSNLLNIVARASVWGILSAVILRLRSSYRVWVCHDLNPRYWPTLLWHSVLFCVCISTAVVNTARPDFGLHRLHMRAGIWIGWSLLLTEFIYYIARASYSRSPYINIWMYIRIFVVAVLCYALGIFSYHNKMFSCDSFLLTFPILFYVVWIELFALPVISVLARYNGWSWLAGLDMMNVAHEILKPVKEDIDTCVFDKIVNDTFLLEKFKARCEKNFLTENLYFLTMMYKMRTLRWSDPTEAAKVLDTIYQQCIQKGGVNSINISAQNRTALLNFCVQADGDSTTKMVANADNDDTLAISVASMHTDAMIVKLSDKDCSMVSVQHEASLSPIGPNSSISNEVFSELLVCQERVLQMLSFHIIEFYKDPEVAEHMARLNTFYRQHSVVRARSVV